MTRVEEVAGAGAKDYVRLVRAFSADRLAWRHFGRRRALMRDTHGG